MLLKEVLNIVDVKKEENFFGTELTKRRLKKAHAEGRLDVRIVGDCIHVKIFSNDPKERFDFKQYRLKYTG